MSIFSFDRLMVGGMQMPMDEVLLRANAEANEVFERMGRAVEARINRGEQELNVLEVAREAGLRWMNVTSANCIYPTPYQSIGFFPGMTGTHSALGGAGGGGSGIPGTTAVHTGGTAVIGIPGEGATPSPNR
jgi:hypothetical protein